MIVGFTGFAQSGKDTAAGFLVEKGFKRLAFADILRTSLYALNPLVKVSSIWIGDPDRNSLVLVRAQEIVDTIGWDRAKVEVPEIRQLLQRLGTEVGRELYGENFWVERVMNQIDRGRTAEWKDYVITDVRFPNEEKAVHDAGGKVIKITRPGNKAANTHASEDIERLFVDLVIPNNGSLPEFRNTVLDAVMGAN